MPENVHESSVGPLIDVTARSVPKAFFTSLLWGIWGGVMIFGGCWMAGEELIGALRAGRKVPEIVYLGAGGIVVGWIIFSILVRKIAAALNSRVHLRAGPRGVSVCAPGGINFACLLACYRLVSREFTWDEVNRCYPAVVRTKGWTTQSDVVFEGKGDWEISITTMILSGSIRKIMDALTAASKRSDLLRSA
jgi:hypothetical protein